jgi:ribosomal protein S27E
MRKKVVYGIWCGHEKANNTRRNNKANGINKLNKINFLDKDTLDWLEKVKQKPKQDVSLYFPYYKGFFYCIHCGAFFKPNHNVTCPDCGKLLYKDTGALDDLLRTYWNSERHLQIRKRIDDYLQKVSFKK